MLQERLVTKNVGTGKTVTVSNLSLSVQMRATILWSDSSEATADITTKFITASGITASNKVYNANTTATLNVSSAALTNGASADNDNKYYTGDTLP